MKQALLIRFGGLGDLLVALPSIRLLRGKYPEAHLILACREEYGALLLGAGVVDEIVSQDSRLITPLFSGKTEAQQVLSDWLGSFELIMGWNHGRKKHFISVPKGSALPAGIHFIHADPWVSGQLSRFFFRKTAEVLGESGVPSIEDWARLPADRVQRTEILGRFYSPEGKKPYAVVHPGSGSENKRWPLRNFLQVISRLGARGVPGALVTGEAEERLEAEIERSVLPHGWSWIRRPCLSALASLLSESAIYLGNDSGVTHLAAAYGTEVVALFRRDLAFAWKPLGRVHLHVGASLGQIELESVWKTIASRLPNFSADSQIF